MKLASLIFLVTISFAYPITAVANALDSVKVQLSWKHQFQFAGFYAALQQGFYEKAGLDVTLLEGGPGVSCNEELLTQKANYCNASGSVVKRRIAGEKIVVLASIIQHSPIVLLTRKDSGIETPKQLIGKRVESMLGGEPIVEIKAMFEKEGIKLSQLENLENSVGIDSLIDNSVDAALAFISNEPHQLDLAGVEYNVIKPENYGIDFYGDVILTSEKELEENTDRAIRFREATIEGWRYALANKEMVVDHIMGDYTDRKNKQALLAEANAIEKLMLPNLIKIGHNNIERWEATAATLAANNVIDSDYSLEGFVFDVEGKGQKFPIGQAVGFFLLVLGLGCLWFYNRRLANEVKKHAKSEERLRVAQQAALEQAYTDELSGMGNRRSCYEYGAQAVDHAKGSQEPISIVMIDIDHFKKINDVHGHAIGDEVIRAMARVIVERIRETDIQGRIGGEEFAIILPDTSLEGAERLAEEVRKELENVAVVAGENIIKMTASFGVSNLKSKNDDINAIMKRADEALYKAKETGRNKVVSL